MQPSVYLAGPEVFRRDAFAVGEAMKAVCVDAGLRGCFPLDIETGLGDLSAKSPADQAFSLFEALIEQLDGCAGVIANITPFRGPSADVGTAWEMGYAFARGLPVFAYTDHAADYVDRVEPDGLQVEAFGLSDNLMLEGSVRRSGSSVVRGPKADDPDVGDLAGGDPPVPGTLLSPAFIACVHRAAAALTHQRYP
jgi:nucleoside 2-deoxyribosyltransferase